MKLLLNKMIMESCIFKKDFNFNAKISVSYLLCVFFLTCLAFVQDICRWSINSNIQNLGFTLSSCVGNEWMNLCIYFYVVIIMYNKCNNVLSALWNGGMNELSLSYFVWSFNYTIVYFYQHHRSRNAECDVR